MRLKRNLSLLFAIIMVLSSASVFTSCNKTKNPNTSNTDSIASVIDGSDVSNTEDSGDLSGTDITSTESTGASSTGNTGTNNSGGNTSKPSGSNNKNPYAPYPNTPGDSNTKKMPKFASELKNTKITFLASIGINDTVKETLATFKQVTGKALEIEYDVVDWQTMSKTLATRVMSDKAPDMVQWGSETVPFLIQQNYFEPIADYINMNDGLWTDTKETNLLGFAKDGKQYAIATDNMSYLRGFIYNKDMMEEADLPDPLTLYKQGKWNWDTFYDAVKELTVDSNKDGVPEVYGASISNWGFGMFLATTGKDIVTFNADGTITDNLGDPNFQRCADYIKKLGDLKLHPETWNYADQFSKGKIAMVLDFAESAVNKALLPMKKAGKLGFVPMPKDPQANKYYIPGQTVYTMIPKGAKNPQGTAAYLYFLRYLDKNPNPALEKKNKNIYINDWGWTEEEYNMFAKRNIDKNHTYINPAGERVPDFSKQQQYWSLPWTYSWSQVLGQIRPSFKAAIDKYNKDIKK